MPARRLDAPLADDSAASGSGPRPLREVLPGLQARDEATWREFVDRYQRLVYSIPRQAGLGAADADDVFQATWLALVRQIDLVRDGDALPSWIITTARRLSLRTRDRRRASAEDPHGLELADETDWIEPDFASERFERAQRVLEAVATLSDRCRALIERLFELGPPAGGRVEQPPGVREPSALAPSYRDIAEELGIPVGSIGPTRQRCLAQLARKLASLRREPG